jgi:hypothetical protein
MHNVGLSDIYIWQVLGHLERLSLSRGVATKHLHSSLSKPKSLFESDKHPTKTFRSIINLRTLQTVIMNTKKDSHMNSDNNELVVSLMPIVH